MLDHLVKRINENSGFSCTSSDMHPYEYTHDRDCIHCAREKTLDHDPDTCALCGDGDYVKVCTILFHYTHPDGERCMCSYFIQNPGR